MADDNGRSQAKAQLESLREMVERLNHCQECDDLEDCELTSQEIYAGLGLWWTEGKEATEEEIEQYHDEEDALQMIMDDPLEVSVRSDWHSPGSEEEYGDYLILLCTGGPAVRIIGELSQYREPQTARLEYQDWFTPWQNYPLNGNDEDYLVRYASCFWFGE